VDGEAVEPLIAGKAADQPTAMRHQAGLPSRDTERDEVEGPEPAGVGFRDIDGGAVGRQADAVRREQGIGDLDDAGAVRQRVVEPAAHLKPWIALAMVGEVEAAMPVEDAVVGPDEAMSAAARIEYVPLARSGVEPLDPAARIPFRHAGADAIDTVDLLEPEAAAVAEIERPIRPHRQPVGRPAGFGHDLDLAVGPDATDGSALDFHDQHGRVRAGDRALGKEQTSGDDHLARHDAI